MDIEDRSSLLSLAASRQAYKVAQATIPAPLLLLLLKS